MVAFIIALCRGEHAVEGQGLVEYALIILLVSLAAVGTLGVFGAALPGQFAKAVAAF